MGVNCSQWESQYDFDRVEKIDFPDLPETNAQADLLKQHEVKIASILRRPGVLGFTVAVHSVTKQFVPLYITYSKTPSTGDLRAYSLDGDLWGCTDLLLFSKTNDYLVDFWITGKPKQYHGYGPESKEVSKVLLDEVHNRSSGENRCKYIGFALTKATMQFFSASENRVILETGNGSHLYHYRLGFRSRNPERNALYKAAQEDSEEGNKRFKYVDCMYLPDQSRQLWREEIGRRPILSSKEVALLLEPK